MTFWLAYWDNLHIAFLAGAIGMLAAFFLVGILYVTIYSDPYHGDDGMLPDLRRALLWLLPLTLVFAFIAALPDSSSVRRSAPPECMQASSGARP